ncbi:MAG: RNA polymerase factor sigma-54, partial [Roseinatronobacter sp.]|nr:RNA polymerase factor sigma-54 [Roseinatronobacter sp.]
ALGLNAQELALAELFVEALAPSGWLDAPLDEIALRAGVPLATAATMLERLQKLEPAGLFARDLAECLRLQAAEQGLLSPVFAAVLNNLPMLAAADLPALCRVCRTDMDTLRQVLRALRGLNPKPGAGFDQAPMPLRAPDLLVSRLTEGGWRLELNNSTLPAVLVRDTDTPARQSRPGAEYLAERLSVSRWLSRAVQYRNQTVLKIGEEILRSQRAFFEHGPGHLRPMILKDIAEAVGIHESTVSRVTNAVTIATPHGCFALKRFFSAALPAQDGNSGSAEAVRERIRKLIQAETPGRPLSDEALVRLLDGEGVAVARRTVAKYREQLRIPTSALRRRQSVISSQL